MTTLALFDLTELNSADTIPCGRCPHNAATHHVHAVQNLLGVHPTWMTGPRYRDALRHVRSTPCCRECAWDLAGSWWAGCPCRGGACRLWVHTLADPHPGWDCPRHHVERVVVWRTDLAVAA